LSPGMIEQFGARLRLEPDVIREACVLQHAEAILTLVQSPGFRTDSRWIAAHTRIPLDAINAALHHVLCPGELVMQPVNRRTISPSSHA